MCRTHRQGKPRKRAPRPARRQKCGEAKGRPSHSGRAGVTDDPLEHFTRNTRNTQVRCNQVNNCPFPKGASLNTGFPMPFLRLLKLRICERASSAGTSKAPSSSPSGKRILSRSANTHHKGTNCFPISRSSSDLDWRTEIVVLALQKRLSISWGDTNSLLTCHLGNALSLVLAQILEQLRQEDVLTVCIVTHTHNDFYFWI